jgi:hypothetical protein
MRQEQEKPPEMVQRSESSFSNSQCRPLTMFNVREEAVVMRRVHRSTSVVASKRRIVLAGVAVAALLATAVQVDLNAANPSANLDQWANLNNAWVNGNLGSSKSTYYEGDSIPYRLTFDNLSLGTHHVIIEWDTTKSSKHALDYLTTFNYRVGKASNVPNPPLNPCAGVTGCGGAGDAKTSPSILR